MNGQQYAQLLQAGEHPPWCARGHHCTARVGGEHASEPQVLHGAGVSAVVTRYLPVFGPAAVEFRLSVMVPPGSDARAAAWLAGLCEAVWATAQDYPRP